MVFFGNTAYLKFLKVWEVVIVRSTSKVICIPVSSMKYQHYGKKSTLLEPEYFSMEMVLRVNFGPLHHLDNFYYDLALNSD